MFNSIKGNIFIILATVFLGVALTFSLTAYGQTSGDCAACGGQSGSGDCYEVNAGASYCNPVGNDCADGGSCENGDHEFD